MRRRMLRLCLTLSVAALLLVGCGGEKTTNPGDGPGDGGSGWSAIGSIEGTVHALFVHGPDLIVGGSFTSAGGVAASNVARWDGSAWSALGPGLPGVVSAFTVIRDTLTAGTTIQVDQTRRFRVAKWDGATWRTLSEKEGEVKALTVFPNQGSLILGGRIPDYPGWADVARWDPVARAWEPLRHNNAVEALALYGSELVAAGFYWNQYGAVARWNGVTWTEIPGILRPVHALAVQGEDLIAGGEFDAGSSDVAASHVARLHAGAWQPLAAGVNGTVYAITVYHDALIVGGAFAMAGADSANGIARWDGTSWHPLGSGLNFTVYALAAYGSVLVAGGAFTEAGGKPAHGVAVWRD